MCCDLKASVARLWSKASWVLTLPPKQFSKDFGNVNIDGVSAFKITLSPLVSESENLLLHT